ncbi:alpha/beta hydrolase [Deinococcus sp. KSM4-11]|uniref:alpha/beta fold hydrolase n=1 Tax=Deinococcus sp. KSM4-11 TaxID=2568654 RepID=UPI0010A483EC|nr:alpha/beta hydrolase [Deinococcus sp. KSM4-11]THF85741.1 alpha/beta hydrolase [Deinococcus sp. KSM4-11]
MTERVLVAVHGNFASAVWWSELLADSPSGWRVLVPTLPGFGGTHHPAGLVSIPAFAAWLSAWLTGRGVGRPVLLGHSLGGAVALELAAQAPETVAGLILAASAPPSGLVTPEENYPVLDLLRTHRPVREASLSALFPSGRPGNFAQYVEDAGRMHEGHYSGNARALAAWRIDPVALRGVPTLVMGGALDTLVTPDMVRATADVLGSRPFILDGVGHGFPQENPAGFREHVTVFLNALPVTGRLETA